MERVWEDVLATGCGPDGVQHAEKPYIPRNDIAALCIMADVSFYLLSSHWHLQAEIYAYQVLLRHLAAIFDIPLSKT